MIVFEKCDAKISKCKSEAEIEEWMGSKYIVTLENEAKFLPQKFDNNRVARRSMIRWYPMSYQTRSDIVNIITRDELSLSDSIFNFGDMMIEQESAF